MPNITKGPRSRTASATERGSVTRDRLLDALEGIAADAGLAALSHRAIAKRARLHTGLIHYHFGTVDRLLEEALARRAKRLSGSQLAALSALFARERWSVEDVVTALWQPFSLLGSESDGGWRNYLCLVARLAADLNGERMLALHYDDVAIAAQRALRTALPNASDEAIASGLRYIRTLFDQESRARCGKRVAPEYRALNDAELTRFAAAGLRGLVGDSTSPQSSSRRGVAAD